MPQTSQSEPKQGCGKQLMENIAKQGFFPGPERCCFRGAHYEKPQDIAGGF